MRARPPGTMLQGPRDEIARTVARSPLARDHMRTIDIEPRTEVAEARAEIGRVDADALLRAAREDDTPVPLAAAARGDDRIAPGPVSDDLDHVDALAILRALRALRSGDFRTRLPEGDVGI